MAAIFILYQSHGPGKMENAGLFKIGIPFK
jgi:hypothetical protein